MGAVSTDTLSHPVQIPCPLHEQCSRFRLGWPVVPPKNLREITTPDWVGSKGEFKQNRNIWTSIFFGPSVPTRVGTRRFWPLCGHEGPKTSGDVFGPPDLFGPSLHDEEVSWAGPWPGLWMPANRVLDTNMSG